MKTTLLLACAVIFLTDIYGQDTWARLTDFGGNIRTGAAGFSIGAKGYLGTGNRALISSTLLKDFWEYDSATADWRQLPGLPGTAREGAVGFSIGGKGYIGLGRSADSGYLRSLWEYDPVANIWRSKAIFPSTGRSYATVFVVNEKAYINFGQNGATLFKDVWEYDPALNLWTPKNPFPGDARVRAAGFAMGAKGYMGTGFNGNFTSPVIKKDFWEYDPVTDGWTQKANFAGGYRHSAMSFVINGKGYMGMGSPAFNTTAKDIWGYDPQADTWTRQMDFSNYSGRGSAVTFAIGNKGYLGTGYISIDGSPTVAVTDFWEYSPCDFQGNAGDPSVFGDNVWNVYAWNSGGSLITNQTWSASYRGYYVDNSLNFDTRNKWISSSSPSAAPGYIGCPVNGGNHSWSAKRKGFDCGHYAISIDEHYGPAQLFIDDVKVWEDTSLNPAGNVWEGDLGADSKIEFRVTIGIFYSSGKIRLSKAAPVITAGGATRFCIGESVALTSSYSSGNQWHKDGLAIEGATGQAYVATETGAYTTKVLLGGCPSFSLPANVTVTTPAGDPTVFGDNRWNVYVWNEGNGTLSASAWQNNYKGFYTDTALSPYTKWWYLGFPSDAVGFQGCSVGEDNHSWSAKRKGFPCGQYKIGIPWHYHATQLFIDGVKIWEHDGCCDRHDSLWQGYLNPDSKIEFRGTEGYEESFGALVITQVRPLITRSSNVVCADFPVTLTASPGNDYIWSTGEHTQSISISQAGTYSVSQTDNCGNLISSNPVTIIALVAPGTNPSGTVGIGLGKGTIKAEGYSGTGYTYAWYKAGQVTPVSNDATFAVNQEGDYYATVSRDNCTSPPSNIVHVVDPAPFGDNTWYVHYFPDHLEEAFDPDYEYYGYYTEPSLSFDTRTRWGADSTPTYASGYQGYLYEWAWDNFKFVAKRRGFPCGHYKINIPGHDDWMELWVNGVKMFNHQGCCDSHPDVWEGDLGPNSTVEFKVIEQYGDAYGVIEFELMSDVAKPTITTLGPVNICSVDNITLTSGATIGNTWSTGDTTQSITVNTAGTYFVTKSSEGCNAQSDPVDITVIQAQTYYADADHDGYGDPASSIQSCTIPAGYVNDYTDCNDKDSTVHAPVQYYIDADHDGYGSNATTMLCSSTPYVGYSTNNTDCDDTKPTVHPSAPEICDGLDNNCNGQIDEGVKTTWYRDADNDGYGNPNISTQACSKPAGYVTNNTDCNDGKATVYPGAPELCDGLDNNCNGQIDDGAGTTWYRDADSDGYGNPGFLTTACKKPEGYVGNNSDCNDAIAAINPVTKWYKDADNDGYYAGAAITSCTSPGTGYKNTSLSGANDCNDNDNTIYPKAPELCDGKDNNCNGTIDEGCATVTVSIDDISRNEGNRGKTTMIFTVSLSAASTKKITVQFATQNGIATAGSDYDAKSGTLTFNPGTTKQTVNISIIGDKTVEPNETFKVNLNNVVNGSLARPAGTGTILNDDAASIASSVSTPDVAEGRSVKIAPNPAKNFFYVELPGYSGNVTLQLVDLQGKILKQEKIPVIANYTGQKMEVSGFAGGNYLLVVTDEKGDRQTKKVIIER